MRNSAVFCIDCTRSQAFVSAAPHEQTTHYVCELAVTLRGVCLVVIIIIITFTNYCIGWHCMVACCNTAIFLFIYIFIHCRYWGYCEHIWIWYYCHVFPLLPNESRRIGRHPCLLFFILQKHNETKRHEGQNQDTEHKETEETKPASPL